MRMTVDRSIPKRSAASLWLSSPVASCSHSSYFWLGLRNRLARRPRRSRPESCWVISTLLLEAEGPYRMRRNQNPDVGHEVRRKTHPCTVITDDASPFALRSTRNRSEESNAPRVRCRRQRRRGGERQVVADIAKLSVGREAYYTRELATDHE